jgi:hypothetical protein
MRGTRRYFSTVRGNPRIPSFSFNSLAMRSSPEAGFLAPERQLLPKEKVFGR